MTENLNMPLPSVGDAASIETVLDDDRISAFASFSGDDNPLHMDDAVAQQLGFKGRVAHGMAYASLLSTLIGTKLPGPGALWSFQSIRFLAPVFVGEVVTLTATAVAVDHAARRVRLAVFATAQDGRRLMEGETEVTIPRPRSGADASQQGQSAEGTAKSIEIDGRGAALVVGAGGALGGAIARRLAGSGRTVILAGRSETSLTPLVETLNDTGIHAEAAMVDLTRDETVVPLFQSCLERGTWIETVIHAASAPLEDVGIDGVSDVMLAGHMAVQAQGMARLARAALPQMRARKCGQFVYVGSTATHGAPPKGLAAYTAAKAAGSSIVRSIALENAAFGVRSNIVSPHFLETDLQSRVPEKARKLVAAQVPARRLATLNEVAEAVLFLTDSTGGYVNGHDLAVDGGVSMR